MDAQLFIPIRRTATINLEVVDFSVVVEPSASVLLVGAVQQFQVTFEPMGGFNAPLYLTVANLPNNAVAQFSAINPVAVSDMVTLTIDATNVEPGLYELHVEAVPG